MARGYLTYEDNGETKEYYTAQTKAYSLTDVALAAPDSVKEQVKSYIVEKATVTFKDGETQLAQTEFNYGDKITYPATSVGADRYVEWKTSKNTTWNTDWTAQQSLTLTANYVDCFGYKVEDCLYNHDENGGNSGFTKSATFTKKRAILIPVLIRTDIYTAECRTLPFQNIPKFVLQ